LYLNCHTCIAGTLCIDTLAPSFPVQKLSFTAIISNQKNSLLGPPVPMAGSPIKHTFIDIYWIFIWTLENTPKT